MSNDLQPVKGNRLPAQVSGQKRQLKRTGEGRQPPAHANTQQVTLARVRPERDARDREFLPAALAILESPPSPRRVAFLYTLCALLAAAIAWSWFGHLDVFADASGKIQATGRTKVIQPMVSGTVIKINARNGDRVKAGDVIVELDPAEAIANLNIAQDKLVNAVAEITRRRVAIATGAKETIDTKPKVTWDPAVPRHVRDREESALRADLSTLNATIANLKAQRKAKETDRDKYSDSVRHQQALILVIKEQVKMTQTMTTRGYNSVAALLTITLSQRQAELQLATLLGSLNNAIAAIPVLDSEIAKTRETFLSTNTQSLVEQQRMQEDLAQQLAKAKQTLKYMTLKASIDGTIQASTVTTIGQVVTTGQQLMQLVPSSGPLEIEAYVLNTDIGFIKVGQKAVIKVSTFPYTRYGTLDGVVTKVANDALTGQQAQQLQKNSSKATPEDGKDSLLSAAQQTSDLVFPVTVVAEKNTMNVDGKKVPLSPGMTVTVEIKTESRRAIDYILSPMAATLQQAAQER